MMVAIFHGGSYGVPVGIRNPRRGPPVLHLNLLEVSELSEIFRKLRFVQFVSGDVRNFDAILVIGGVWRGSPG